MPESNGYPVLDFSGAVFMDLKSFSSMDKIYKILEYKLCSTGINKPAKKVKPEPQNYGHKNHSKKLLAYVVNRDENTVSVVDILGFKKLTDIAVGNVPYDLDISSDKRFVYVSNGADNTLSVIKTSDNRVVDTINLNNDGFEANGSSGVRVSSSGRYVYVANFDAGTISIISTRTNQIIGTVPVGKSPQFIDILDA